MKCKGHNPVLALVLVVGEVQNNLQQLALEFTMISSIMEICMQTFPYTLVHILSIFINYFDHDTASIYSYLPFFKLFKKLKHLNIYFKLS